MTVREFTQQDEQEFEEYLDALGEVMNHERRLLPLTSYCTGLLLPLDSKTMEAMAATLAPQRTLALHHRLQNFITDAPWSERVSRDNDRSHINSDDLVACGIGCEGTSILSAMR